MGLHTDAYSLCCATLYACAGIIAACCLHSQLRQSVKPVEGFKLPDTFGSCGKPYGLMHPKMACSAVQVISANLSGHPGQPKTTPRSLVRVSSSFLTPQVLICEQQHQILSASNHYCVTTASSAFEQVHGTVVASILPECCSAQLTEQARYGGG